MAEEWSQDAQMHGPRVWPARVIVEAILYVGPGRVRLAVPSGGLPALADGIRVFAAWRDDGILARLHDVLRAQYPDTLVIPSRRSSRQCATSIGVDAFQFAGALGA